MSPANVQVTVIKCKAPSTSFNAFHSRLSVHSLAQLQITGKYVSFRVPHLLKRTLIVLIKLTLIVC